MIKINLSELLKDRQMSSKELTQIIDITEANLSILRSGKAKAIRFSTLDSICKALHCQPGDILEYIEGDLEEGDLDD
ncbi:transcriptional regulator [Tenericutes bacterium MZ-XQ]|nr:transcriptional regulator [Tenericutes bacterium MZ-XQ]